MSISTSVGESGPSCQSLKVNNEPRSGAMYALVRLVGQPQEPWWFRRRTGEQRLRGLYPLSARLEANIMRLSMAKLESDLSFQLFFRGLAGSLHYHFFDEFSAEETRKPPERILKTLIGCFSAEI